jgi:hypothetical protein
MKKKIRLSFVHTIVFAFNCATFQVRVVASVEPGRLKCNYLGDDLEEADATWGEKLHKGVQSRIHRYACEKTNKCMVQVVIELEREV